eukprot:14004841-Alexandrium_andersonii.AAC.1
MEGHSASAIAPGRLPGKRVVSPLPVAKMATQGNSGTHPPNQATAHQCQPDHECSGPTNLKHPRHAALCASAVGITGR